MEKYISSYVMEEFAKYYPKEKPELAEILNSIVEKYITEIQSLESVEISDITEEQAKKKIDIKKDLLKHILQRAQANGFQIKTIVN